MNLPPPRALLLAPSNDQGDNMQRINDYILHGGIRPNINGRQVMLVVSQLLAPGNRLNNLQQGRLVELARLALDDPELTLHQLVQRERERRERARAQAEEFRRRHGHLGFGRKSRKSSRKSVRKSRKSVRKSRKSVRKSRKSSRKSRKSSRKSRKSRSRKVKL